MRFVLVLTAGHHAEAALTVSELARAASEKGHRVDIFLAGDGIVHAADLSQASSVALCDADLRWRSAGSPDVGRAKRGSLRDLARECSDADRVLVFR